MQIKLKSDLGSASCLQLSYNFPFRVADAFYDPDIYTHTHTYVYMVFYILYI